jgi:hypothetical protein
MSTQVSITATHRGRSRRIVVEPIKGRPRKESKRKQAPPPAKPSTKSPKAKQRS